MSSTSDHCRQQDVDKSRVGIKQWILPAPRRCCGTIGSHTSLHFVLDYLLNDSNTGVLCITAYSTKTHYLILYAKQMLFNCSVQRFHNTSISVVCACVQSTCLLAYILNLTVARCAQSAHRDDAKINAVLMQNWTGQRRTGFIKKCRQS